VDVDVYARTRTMNLCTAPEPITMDSHTQWTFRLDHAATYKLGEETHLKLRLFHTVRDSDRVTDLLVQPRHEKLAIGREKPMWNGGCHVETSEWFSDFSPCLMSQMRQTSVGRSGIG
jgi:hypothetical protein